jgi:hypothetical protein
LQKKPGISWFAPCALRLNRQQKPESETETWFYLKKTKQLLKKP